MIGSVSSDTQTCSRAGCDLPATHSVNWRNPKIHSVDRVKVWLACDEHVGYLHDYLEARDFPVIAAPLDTVITFVPDVAGAGHE